jgi:hypothetical protein
MDTNVKVEAMTLQDGRRAERHCYVDEQGKEIVEIFAEDKKPLKLEKRVVRESKTVLARETTETVRDGEVIEKQVVEIPEPVMQLTQHIGLANHAKVVDGEYVSRKEVEQLVTDGVVAGITTLLESKRESLPMQLTCSEKRVSAQAVVEQNVEDKQSQNNWLNYALIGLVVAQVGVFVYYITCAM